MNQPRSINSTKPFVTTAREYVSKNWGVLPLPRRQKEHPPTGFTGRAGKFADDDDLTGWLSDPKYSEGNIALRLGNMLVIDGVKYEVIGIDVDNYSGKQGGKELSRLERDLGKLPDTWASSSRGDGVSGIRFYLVPYGYGFRGKASDSIDIVQRVHRYAVIYPSWHPTTKAQYFWYEPGKPIDGQSFTLEIPDARSLTKLTDPWIDHLTRNRMADTSFGDGSYGIDLDISREDLMAWVKKNFNTPIDGEPGGMCPKMRDAVERHCERIESSASNHDRLINAHYNLLHLCCEGHSGHEEAIREINAVWFKDIKAKGKRDLSTVKGEMKRSFDGTLRKIKAKADSFAEIGLSFFSRETCMPTKDFKPPPVRVNGGKKLHWINSVPLRIKEDPEFYDANDVSQAKFFIDRVADNVRYLSDYNGWIIYDGTRWHIDDFALVRDLYDRACAIPNKRRGLELRKKLAQHISSGGTDTDAIGGPLKRDGAKLLKAADLYRNDAKIKGMLNCLKSIPGVAMKYSQLNWDTTLLAMNNGKVLKLQEAKAKGLPGAQGFSIVDNKKEYLITMTTAVELLPWSGIRQHEKDLWSSYLDLFLPDLAYRRFVQKALGYILIGGNPEKLAIFLVGIRNTGKSTMIQALQAVMEDYGATFQPQAVFKDSGSGNNPELGNLLHKRGIFSSESGSQRIYANPFKRNTGGDKVSVTRKYANDQIIGIPHFIPVVATNQPPTIDDADEALVKRIMVLPFGIQVPADKNDTRADVVIPRDAKHAIFHWLVMGYRAYVREGLAFTDWPDQVKQACLEFAAELSDVATFLNETVEVAPDSTKSELVKDVIDVDREMMRKEWSKVSLSALHQSYLNEMTEGQKPLSTRAFAKKVRQMFGVTVVPVRRDNKIVKSYLGLKWINQNAMNQVKG